MYYCRTVVLSDCRWQHTHTHTCTSNPFSVTKSFRWTLVDPSETTITIVSGFLCGWFECRVCAVDGPPKIIPSNVTLAVPQPFLSQHLPFTPTPFQNIKLILISLCMWCFPWCWSVQEPSQFGFGSISKWIMYVKRNVHGINLYGDRRWVLTKNEFSSSDTRCCSTVCITLCTQYSCCMVV